MKKTAFGFFLIISIVIYFLQKEEFNSVFNSPHTNPTENNRQLSSIPGYFYSKELPLEEANLLINRVKNFPQAQNGETVISIITQVSKKAHFYPKRWLAANSENDSGEIIGRFVTLYWTLDEKSEEDDSLAITWNVNSNGTPKLITPYARTMELGWNAFALSLIQDEINEDVLNPNKPFLHTLENLNFVNTPQGKLGDLLKKRHCSITEPLYVDYTDNLKPNNETKSDFWRLQLSVNCKTDGPQYFIKDGIIIFLKKGWSDWIPESVFAKRIYSNPPEKWFSKTEVKNSLPAELQALEDYINRSSRLH